MRLKRSKTQLNSTRFNNNESNSRIKRTNSSLMAHQFLRLAVLQKQQIIKNIFNMNQKQLCDYFINYTPLSYAKIDVKRIVEEKLDEVRLVKSTNKIYFGGVNKNSKNGEGILIDNNGKIYEGKFEDDCKNGHGVEIYPNGNIYIGNFEKNKKHGKGQFYWFNLSPPEKEDAKHIEFYDGNWWGGLPDGKGSHQKSNGDIYDGQFKNGLKHGRGQQYFHNGDSYKGEYVNGLPQGFGLYVWNDGSKYQGDFKQGLRSGHGIWISADGKDQYKGQYLLDKKSGYGEYSWLDRTFLYKGNFEDDLRHGYGQMYKNGIQQYKGQWVRGRIKQKIQVDDQKKQNSMAQTFVESRFPSLSKLKPPSSSIIQRIKNTAITVNPQVNNTLQRSRSPKTIVHSLGKTTVGLLKPRKKVVSMERTIKKRPISSVYRNFCDKCTKYELLVKKCTKKNCGCNISVPLDHKLGPKERRRLTTQLVGKNKCC